MLVCARACVICGCLPAAAAADGAHEPAELDFYLAQRSALSLPATGFATTTDIQRALHPPNKQVDLASLPVGVLLTAWMI